MKHYRNQIISLGLAAVMVLTSAGTVFAADTAPSAGAAAGRMAEASIDAGAAQAEAERAAQAAQTTRADRETQAVEAVGSETATATDSEGPAANSDIGHAANSDIGHAANSDIEPAAQTDAAKGDAKGDAEGEAALSGVDDAAATAAEDQTADSGKETSAALPEERQAASDNAAYSETGGHSETGVHSETSAYSETGVHSETGAHSGTAAAADSSRAQLPVIEAPKALPNPVSDETDEPVEILTARESLMAFILNKASTFDNSTTLKDGTYTPDDYKFEGGTGKARLDCESVTVKDGKATAILTASKTSMTHVSLNWTDAEADDPALYDPDTGALGTDVYAIESQKVEIPVAVNTSMKVAGRTTAMGTPHWIKYTITITVNEPADEEPADDEEFDNSTTLKDGVYIPSDYSFEGGTGKARFDCEKVTVKNGKATAVMVSSSKNMTHISLRETEEPSEDPALYDPDTDKTGKLVYALSDKKAEIPVKLNEDMAIAGRTTAMSIPHWIGYTIHITVKDEDRQDEDVVYNVAVKAVDSSTGEAVSGAQITVTDASGSAVAAEGGTYALTGTAAYTVKASADGYDEATQSYTASKDETLTLKMTKTASEEPAEPEKSGTLKIVSNAAMFKVVSASLEGSGAAKVLRVALSASGYQYLFKGSKEDAAVSKQSERIKGTKNADGKWEFLIPVTDEGTFAVAALSSRQNAWYDRTIILDQKAMTISTESADPFTSIPVPDGEDRRGQKTDDKDSGTGNKDNQESKAGYQDASNVGTAAVNSSTTLADGTYGPGDFKFSFSGGTGKVVIVCEKVVVRGGQAYATIKFQKPDGRASSVDSVRANGTTYGGINVFEIPVQLNVNNTVVGRTTAMSQPHWIEYQIFIGMTEPGKAAGKDLSSSKTMDDEAPAIMGLTAKDETEVVYSDRFRIFNYEDDIYLIEVDLAADTARGLVDDEQEELSAAADEVENEDEAAAGSNDSGDGISTAEEEAAPAESEAAITAKLYLNDIVKYLVVPEGTDIPAGLGKEVVVIQQPADRTYVSSESALELLADLGVLENVTTIGLETESIENESLSKALEESSGADDLTFAGPYDKWDLKKMIVKKTNFAVQSSGFLPCDEETFQKDMANFERLTSRSAQMGMACFVDRSEDEENDLARAEWYKVYGIIFGQIDKAETAYKNVVSKASTADKKAALDLLETRAAARESKNN